MYHRSHSIGWLGFEVTTYFFRNMNGKHIRYHIYDLLVPKSILFWTFGL